MSNRFRITSFIIASLFLAVHSAAQVPVIYSSVVSKAISQITVTGKAFSPPGHRSNSSTRQYPTIVDFLRGELG
jgi:hypothetical protein